jgi:hypothetical protein
LGPRVRPGGGCIRRPGGGRGVRGRPRLGRPCGSVPIRVGRCARSVSGRRRIRPGWGSRCPSGWPPIASAPAVVRASARPLHCRHRAVASGAEVEERDLSERLAAAAHSRQGRPRTRHDPSPRSVQIRSRIRSRFVRCPARSSASRSPCSAWATCIRRRRSAAGWLPSSGVRIRCVGLAMTGAAGRSAGGTRTHALKESIDCRSSCPTGTTRAERTRTCNPSPMEGDPRGLPALNASSPGCLRPAARTYVLSGP